MARHPLDSQDLLVFVRVAELMPAATRAFVDRVLEGAGGVNFKAASRNS